MQNDKKLVNIAEHISCDVELYSGRYIVDTKSLRRKEGCNTGNAGA